MKPDQYPEHLRELVLGDRYGSWTNSDRSARLTASPHMWRLTINGAAHSTDMVEDIITALHPIRA